MRPRSESRLRIEKKKIKKPAGGGALRRVFSSGGTRERKDPGGAAGGGGGGGSRGRGTGRGERARAGAQRTPPTPRANPPHLPPREREGGEGDTGRGERARAEAQRTTPHPPEPPPRPPQPTHPTHLRRRPALQEAQAQYQTPKGALTAYSQRSTRIRRGCRNRITLAKSTSARRRGPDIPKARTNPGRVCFSLSRPHQASKLEART